MSRIGKLPVEIPGGVSVAIDGNEVQVKGPKGSLSKRLAPGVSVVVDGKSVVVSKVVSDKQAAADFGTTRALIQAMVVGASSGWKKNLEMTGVGFGAKLVGEELILSCGFSHEVRLQIPSGVGCSVGKTSIELQSCDRELVGRFAATIRNVQPPEPYLGKGIRYSDEVIRRKAGKTGKK